MSGVRRASFVVRCVLFVDFCLLASDCCVLVRCLLLFNYCLLFVVCCVCVVCVARDVCVACCALFVFVVRCALLVFVGLFCVSLLIVVCWLFFVC